MNKIKVFENPEFGSIRTLQKDGEPWFVGKDVAEVLGYSNASKAVLTHVDSEDKRFLMLNIADSQNGNVPSGQTGQSKTAIINESGLYSLILSSKLPTAKKSKLPLAVLKLFKQINCGNRGNQYTGGRSANCTSGVLNEELAAKSDRSI